MSDSEKMMSEDLLVSGIKLSLDASESDALKIASLEMKRAGIDPARLRFSIYKKSIDARKKNDIKLVYSVAAHSESRILASDERLAKFGIKRIADGEISPKIGKEKMLHRPLVVGMGPAGLFSALLLAEHGYAPIIIDRGDCVEKRCAVNANFIENGALDTESNIQFGAGGAGTFSDGKLMTRINDAKISYALATLKSCCVVRLWIFPNRSGRPR